jgi:hypothetical protein
MKFARIITVFICLFIANQTQAANVAREMATAANNLLNSLDSNKKAKANFDFNGKERLYWHFVPSEMLEGGNRKGLMIKEMNAKQRSLTHKLLLTVLSEGGHGKVKNIMFLEEILYVLEGKNRRFVRNSDAYHILIFGQPGKNTWGWRFEGHHLSLNYTIAAGKLRSVPSFWGSNPAVCDFGPGRTLVTLKIEEETARKLRLSLNGAQARQATIADKAPRDILTAALPKVEALDLTGIAFNQLKQEQQALLTTLIKEYINRHRTIVAKEDWNKIEKGGLSKIHFSWAGSTKQFEPHYYRVQGPSFLLEYANTQNGANHIHATWRDFAGDFGGDILREHFRKNH